MCSENPPPPSAQWPRSPSPSPLPPHPLPGRGGPRALSGAAATFPASSALIGEARPLSLVAPSSSSPRGSWSFREALQLGGGHRGVYQLPATLICYECHVCAAKRFDFWSLACLEKWCEFQSTAFLLPDGGAVELNENNLHLQFKLTTTEFAEAQQHNWPLWCAVLTPSSSCWCFCYCQMLRKYMSFLFDGGTEDFISVNEISHLF